MMDYVTDAAATMYFKDRQEDLEKLPDVPHVARPLLQQNSNTLVSRAVAMAMRCPRQRVDGYNKASIGSFRQTLARNMLEHALISEAAWRLQGRRQQLQIYRMSRTWNAERLFQLVIDQHPAFVRDELSDYELRQEWYKDIKDTGCNVQVEGYIMTLQAMMYRTMGRHNKDTLANMEVAATAIIDDRCRKADLELVNAIGWAVMMISVEVRRACIAVETFKKKGFWNEAGRSSGDFEPPRCEVRFKRFRTLREFNRGNQTGYKCMDVTVDPDSLDHLITQGMVTRRDRDQVEQDHGGHLSSVGKKHALTEMILFSEGTSKVKACVHMATDDVQRLNQVSNPDIHTEARDVMTVGLTVGFEQVTTAVKKTLHWIGKTREKHDEYTARREKDKSFVPPEGELGEPLTQLMMMQMREFTRCRYCDTPHRTDRLIHAQVIMKSLIAVDSRLSEDFEVGPRHS